ncbi:uncharacterized protein LOC104001423 [Pan troglodytes]|uniref:uncharacterized protein LOC104001423 n=1 Tax=Pan troglodytes TaxID=9598 RepID=UPI0007DBACB2|nr:uncharacterized protein LOC104001423 [Pan troglodytes]
MTPAPTPHSLPYPTYPASASDFSVGGVPGRRRHTETWGSGPLDSCICICVFAKDDRVGWALLSCGLPCWEGGNHVHLGPKIFASFPGAMDISSGLGGDYIICDPKEKKYRKPKRDRGSGADGTRGRPTFEQSCPALVPWPGFLVRSFSRLRRNPQSAGSGADTSGRRDSAHKCCSCTVGPEASCVFCCGWGGWVGLCLSMQFLIFVNINSKSLVHWEMCNLPENLFCFWSASGVASGPRAFAAVPPPAPTSSVCLQSLIYRTPRCLLYSLCAWPFCYLA